MTTTATEPTTRYAVCAWCGGHLSIDPAGRATIADPDYTDDPAVCPCSRDRQSPHRVATEPTPMDEVTVGDVLYESGLRCEVTEVRVWNHPGGYAHGGPRTVHIARTRILNTEWLADDDGARYLFGGIIARDGSDGWTFQGVAERKVAREVPAT